MEKEIRILHLVEYLYLGGIERLLVQFAEYTPREEGELFFCAYEMEQEKGLAQEIKALGREVYLYKKKGGFDRNLLRYLKDLVVKNRIDIIHTHDFGPMEYAFLLKLSLPFLKLVHTQHTLYHFLPNLKYRLAYQFVSYFYDRIVGVSSYVVKELERKCPLARKNLSVIYNGVDVESFKAMAPDQLSGSTGGPEGATPLCLVSVSRISPEKNLPFLLECCRRLRDQGLDFSFHHAGSGTPELEKKARDFIEENGLSGHVTLYGYQKDIRFILEKGDMFLTASFTEGHPVAVLEALASGKICLCSNIPAHKFIPADKGVLSLFSLHDPDELVRLILTLQGERSRWPEIRKKGMELVRQKFSLDTMINNYRYIYVSLQENK